MNVGQLRVLVKKLINSYSADGQLIPLSDNADVDLAIVDFLNTAYYKAIQYDPIEAVFPITQTIIPNLLYVYDAFNIKQHLDTDIIVLATGVKSYYFEVDKPCVIYIEESISGVWTNLSTITVTGITSFAEYSGLISPSSVSNAVRIRFSGSYPYNIRRTALYGYTFASVADVPKFKPYVSYQLPDNYIKLNKIVQNSDDRLHQDMIDYSIEKRNLLINYFYAGSFDTFYFKRPDELVLDSDSPETQLQNHSYLAYFAAGQWLFVSGQQEQGLTLLNMFDSFMNETALKNDESNSGVISYSEW